MSYERKVKNKGPTPNKQAINNFISCTMLTPGGRGRAIVMDGPTFGSGKAMISAGVDGSAIVSFGREISPRARPGFKVVCGESTNVLQLYSKIVFRVIYLDYMTNKIGPNELEDIERAASMVGKHGIFLVTLSLCVRNSGQCDMVRENIVQSVREKLRDKGFESAERNYREPGKINGMKLICFTKNRSLYIASRAVMRNELSVCESFKKTRVVPKFYSKSLLPKNRAKIRNKPLKTIQRRKTKQNHKVKFALLTKGGISKKYYTVERILDKRFVTGVIKKGSFECGRTCSHHTDVFC